MNPAPLAMAATDFTLSDLLQSNARRHADRPAFVHGATLSHHDQLLRTQRLASGLRAAGVGPGDRVAILSRNRFAFMDLLGAAAHLGAMVSAINWRLSAAEVALVLQADAPRLVLVEDGLWASIDGALAQPGAPEPLTLDAFRQGVRHVDSLHLDRPFEAANVSADAPLLLIHTAWSDLRPKAATLSHRNLLANALQLQAAWSLTARDVHLCCLPLFHVTAISLTLATQLAGGCSVLMPDYKAAEALSLIGEHQVSLFAEFAPMLGGLLDAAEAPAASAAALASLRHVCGLDTPQTIERLASICPAATFWTAYGQSEAAGMVSLGPWREVPGSVGWPLPLCAVEIVDAQGECLPPGAVGEITVRGPGVFAGYWQRPQDNAHALRSGRLHTGDIGELDAQGLLWYRGRLASKQLIKTGGENVYPQEVEAVLRQHPQVADVVVIGVADAQWGESVRAVCVAGEGAALGAQELIDFVAERIARYKRPRSVVFVPALPRQADGSHDRERIQQLHS